MRMMIVLLFIFLAWQAGAGNLTPAPAPGVSPPPPPPPNRQARGCGDNDFRMDRDGGSMEGILVRNQGPAGICPAMAAADLVDAWGRTHSGASGYRNREHRTAPMIAAIANSVYVKRNTVGGGGVDSVYEWIRQHGSCDQVQLSVKTPASDTDGRYRELESEFNSLYDLMYEKWDHLLDKTETVDQVAADLSCRFGSEVLPSGVVRSYEGIRDALASSSRIGELFEQLFAQACDGHIETPVLPPLKVVDLAPFQPHRISGALNSIFNHNSRPQPVAMRMCYEMFKRGDSFDQDAHGCSSHYAVVIGRRWNPKTIECEYLIRNSYGDDGDGGVTWLGAALLDRGATYLTHLNPEE